MSGGTSISQNKRHVKYIDGSRFSCVISGGIQTLIRAAEPVNASII